MGQSGLEPSTQFGTLAEHGGMNTKRTTLMSDFGTFLAVHASAVLHLDKLRVGFSLRQLVIYCCF